MDRASASGAVCLGSIPGESELLQCDDLLPAITQRLSCSMLP